MGNIHDFNRYKLAREKLKTYEPFFNNLCKFSDYLFNNLHLPDSFDILEQVESSKIMYCIEISELKRILRNKACPETFKLKLITKGNISDFEKK